MNFWMFRPPSSMGKGTITGTRKLKLKQSWILMDSLFFDILWNLYEWHLTAIFDKLHQSVSTFVQSKFVSTPVRLFQPLKRISYEMTFRKTMQKLCKKLLNGKSYPVFLWKHSVPGYSYGYRNHPKRTVSPHLVTCSHVRGNCSFGLVTVTVSLSGYRDIQKNTG